MDLLHPAQNCIRIIAIKSVRLLSVKYKMTQNITAKQCKMVIKLYTQLLNIPLGKFAFNTKSQTYM